MSSVDFLWDSQIGIFQFQTGAELIMTEKEEAKWRSELAQLENVLFCYCIAG